MYRTERGAVLQGLARLIPMRHVVSSANAARLESAVPRRPVVKSSSFDAGHVKPAFSIAEADAEIAASVRSLSNLEGATRC